MTAALQTTMIDGLSALTIDTPMLTLVVLPEVGAKVISLRWKASRNEQPPTAPNNSRW